MTWQDVRLEAVAPRVSDTVDPRSFGDQLVEHYSIPSLDETGQPEVVRGADIMSAKQLLRGGEVMVSRLNPRKARIIAVPAVGGVAVASGEFVIVSPCRVEPRFLTYLLLSERIRQYLDSRVQSVTRSHQRIRPEVLLKMRVRVPALSEQRAIADYLDTETSRIDTLITKKRRMIALLEERWTARTGSVLARFDPVPLKRFVTKIGSGSTPRGGADVYVPSGPAFLRSQNIQKGVVDLSDVVFIDRVAQDELRRALVHTGDVLLNITGGSIGRAAVFDRSDIRAYVSQHVCIVRPAPGVDAGVLCAELSSHSVQDQIAVTQVGGNRPGLNFEQVGNLLVRVPPSDQSQAIAQELANGFSRNMRMIETARTQINLLTERRQALITATVTGESVPAQHRREPS